MISAKISDFIIAFIVLAISASLFALAPRDFASESIVVKTPNSEYRFPVDINEVYRVRGEKGETVIEVKDKKVRVIDSSCPNKICVKQGFCTAIVCLPNRVEIFCPHAVKAASSRKIDAITQ